MAAKKNEWLNESKVFSVVTKDIYVYQVIINIKVSAISKISENITLN